MPRLSRRQEVCLIKGKDRRKNLSEAPNFNPDTIPYRYIFRLETYLDCCFEWNQGTAFLTIADDRPTHCFLATAAHVLFCREHGKLGSHVKIFTSPAPGGARQHKSPVHEVYRKTWNDKESWYAVSPSYRVKTCDKTHDQRTDIHDFGVVAVQKGKMPLNYVYEDHREKARAGFHLQDFGHNIPHKVDECLVRDIPLSTTMDLLDLLRTATQTCGMICSCVEERSNESSVGPRSVVCGSTVLTRRLARVERLSSRRMPTDCGLLRHTHRLLLSGYLAVFRKRQSGRHFGQATVGVHGFKIRRRRQWM